MNDALFQAEPFTVTPPIPANLSADRKRTQRQRAALDHGWHPLGLALGYPIPLHPDAAPPSDPEATGRRCGTCRFRELLSYHDRTYPKCLQGWDGSNEQPPRRVTHGTGTDIRAWWPACRDHEYGDPQLSADAYRSGPCDGAGAA
jgi:hypothetical protein